MLEQLVHYYSVFGTCSLACPRYHLFQHVQNDSVLWYQLFNISHSTDNCGIFLIIITMILKNLGHIEELEPQY